MKTCNPKYIGHIPALIQQATGSLPLELKPIPSYLDTIIYEATLPAGAVIFKAIDPDGHDPDGIGLEAWMCETVRRHGIPAPRVLHVDTSHKILPASYFIMEKASGQPLANLPDAQRPAFLRQAGAYLRQMHTLQTERFGWLDEHCYRASGIVQGSEAMWRTAVLRDVPASIAYFQQTGALEPQYIAMIKRLVEQADPWLEAISVGHLLHGDLGSLHIWVDVDHASITSFVDFGERAAGDPIWDIMRFDWEGVPTLIEGYEFDVLLRERFRPTFHLYAVLQALPWAWNWHARGATHTVEWLKTTLIKAAPYFGL